MIDVPYFEFEAPVGLIGQYDGRFSDQCPCQCNPLLLTSGQLVGFVVMLVLQPDQIQNPVQVLGILARIFSIDDERQLDVLFCELRWG